MPEYAWKIFLENAIEMVSIIPSKRASEAQTFRNYHHLANSQNLNGNIWCSLAKGYRAFMCDEDRFQWYRIIGLYTTKMKTEQTAMLYPERSRCAPVLSVRESVVTFYWCSVYFNNFTPSCPICYCCLFGFNVAFNNFSCAPSGDSESSLSAWRKLGSLATHWVHSEDSDQTGRMPRLIWVFARRTVILLVLSWGSSYKLVKKS